jgi:hypothetical protein
MAFLYTDPYGWMIARNVSLINIIVFPRLYRVPSMVGLT